MTITVSLLVALVGALVYAFTPNKVAELGRLAFAVGLLAFLLQLGGRVVFGAG